MNKIDTKEIKVLLAPSVELASTIVADATVEAEYGDTCVEGRVVTLAHHGTRSMNPAPCNWDVTPLNSGVILVSHIDLDTVGGCLALMGLKPEDPEFWAGAEYVDVNGPHHIHELSMEVQSKLNAVYAWRAEMRQNQQQSRIVEVTDVTETIYEWLSILNLVTGNPDEGWIAKGKQWSESITAQVESKLVDENETVRTFVTDGVFCSSSYYSPTLHVLCKATVVLNTRFNSITVGIADTTAVSAKDFVQSIWGENAGGHRGIAGSPRGQQMTKEDLMYVCKKLQDTLQ